MAQTKQTQTDKEGNWKVYLDPLQVQTEPQVLTVTTDRGEKVQFTDILVGEVWFCSGQSNMEMGLGACYDGEKLMAAADHPNLRIYTTPMFRTSYLPLKDPVARWDVCTPETVQKGNFKGFCAIGYFFALHLQEYLNIPIGIINSSWGGTPIRAWIAPEGFALRPSMAGNVRDIKEKTAQYTQALAKAVEMAPAWCDQVKASLQKGEMVPEPQYRAPQPPPYNHNCAIYNTQIHPLIPFTFRGFLWYQGEHEVIDDPCGRAYYEKMHALVDGWRQLWKEDLPFYYVQLAPWNYPALYKYRMDIIDAQNKALDLPKSGLVMTADVTDNVGDIHPRIKKPVGERLANLALTEVYGVEGLKPYIGVMREVELCGNLAKVRFDNAYEGLKTADGKAPECFEVAGSDGAFVAAAATITGPDEVTVNAPSVPEIKYVQFGRGLLDRSNLRNGADLPVNVFSTYDRRVRTLAFGCPTTSDAEYYWDKAPDYATDGYVENHNGWTGVKVPQSLTVDLGSNQTLSRVDVYPFCDGKCFQLYTVEVSTDGENWEQVGSRSEKKPCAEKEEWPFSSRDVRYVKVNVTETQNNAGPRINEVTAYAGKLAQ